MLPDHLPERVDAAKLFARFGSIEAALPLGRLSRLVPYLAGTDGQAEVSLKFGLDAEGRKLLSGSVVANLDLVCQRCLKGMKVPVSSELSLLVFNDRKELDGQMSQQAQENLAQDVLLLDEMQSVEVQSEGPSAGKPDGKSDKGNQELDVIALVEDELILSLPLAPMHEDVDCNKLWSRIRDQEPQEERHDLGSSGNNPFAMLAKLKKDLPG